MLFAFTVNINQVINWEGRRDTNRSNTENIHYRYMYVNVANPNYNWNMNKNSGRSNRDYTKGIYASEGFHLNVPHAGGDG